MKLSGVPFFTRKTSRQISSSQQPSVVLESKGPLYFLAQVLQCFCGAQLKALLVRCVGWKNAFLFLIVFISTVFYSGQKNVVGDFSGVGLCIKLECSYSLISSFRFFPFSIRSIETQNHVETIIAIVNDLLKPDIITLWL